jgi:hypothetical protein
VQATLSALDHAFSWFAVPFGVRVRDPRVRYALLLGVFVLIYVLGALPRPFLPLVALGFGYVGVLATGRAWVLNEKERTAIVKKLSHEDPDQLPDLRWTALVSALQLLILFPLLFQQVHWHYHLYRVDGTVTFGDWLWFSLDKIYLKALPDWSILYGVHISSIDFDAPWGRHLVMLSRLTFDYILIQGVLRLLAIRATIGEAVAAVKADPDMAVRLGKRAVGPLLEKLHDPDKGGARGGGQRSDSARGQPRHPPPQRGTEKVTAAGQRSPHQPAVRGPGAGGKAERNHNVWRLRPSGRPGRRPCRPPPRAPRPCCESWWRT